MNQFTPIDLSKLPAPSVIETPDFDALLAQMKAEVVKHMPNMAAFLELESEPATQILRVCAYFRMLDRAQFNDGARACLLAYATGASLDHLGAFWNVARQVVQAADDSTNPPIAQIMEDDTAYRARIQLAPEGLTSAGSRGAYKFFALGADGRVKDASITSPSGGVVSVSVLAHAGDGSAPADLINIVDVALRERRPLTDQVNVTSAQIIPYVVEANLTLYDGPDASTVENAALSALTVYVNDNHRIGHDITLSGIYAALHQAGVQNVQIVQPAADITVDAHQAAYCGADDINIRIGGRDV